MTTMKSLKTRLNNIPEPDLERAQSELRYQWLKQFSFEQWLALDEVCRVAERENRATITREDIAGAFGISMAELDASVRAMIEPTLSESPSSDSEMPASSPATKEVANAAAGKPKPKKSKKALPPSGRSVAAPNPAASAEPSSPSEESALRKPAPEPSSDVPFDERSQANMRRMPATASKRERLPPSEEKDPFLKQFSFEQRLALRHLSLNLEKAGRAAPTRREICAVTGISMVELTVKLAKARHPEIAPDTKPPGTSPAPELEAKEIPIKPKPKMVKKSNKGSRPTGSISAAPKPVASAGPRAKSVKSRQPKKPFEPGTDHG